MSQNESSSETLPSIPTSLTNFEWCNLINAHDITNTVAQLGDVVDL